MPQMIVLESKTKLVVQSFGGRDFFANEKLDYAENATYKEY
jgi:hypothetical protein